MSIPLHPRFIANGACELNHQDLEQIQAGDFLVAVDGGLMTCAQYGLTPNALIGDFDSLSKELLESFSDVPKTVYSCDKDLSDLELAFQHWIGPHTQTALCYGALGKRTDHTLYNLFVLQRYAKILKFISAKEEVFVLDAGSHTLFCQTGQTLSFFALGSLVEKVSSIGLKWELINRDFGPHFQSLSNECVQDEVCIQFLSGQLICFLQKFKP